jgi:hypothetical protein
MEDGERDDRRRGVSDDGDGDDEEICVRKDDCDCDAPLAILLYAAVLPYPDAGDA